MAITNTAWSNEPRCRAVDFGDRLGLLIAGQPLTGKGDGVMPTPERSNDARWPESLRAPDPGSASGSSAPAGEWWNRFAGADQPRRSRLPLITAAILALVVIVTVVVVHWLTTQPANSNSTVNRSSAPTTQLGQSADPGVEDRLLHLLPPGYVPAEWRTSGDGRRHGKNCLRAKPEPRRAGVGDIHLGSQPSRAESCL